MAYIAKVHIQGFQSHFDSTFTLSPGLNVITGPSDAGKTAIIRALRWFAFNEPQGEAFIHVIRDNSGEIIQAADRATVAVEFDNGVEITKTRRKGKTVYTHSEYPDAWEKAELPLEIKEVLGLDKQRYGDNFDTCLNFAYQLDPPFLLSETGSVGAKVLGKLAGTEVVDKAIGVIVKQMHQTREIIRHADKAVGQYDVELLDYLHTKDNLKAVGNLETIYKDVEADVAKYNSLCDMGKRYSYYDEIRGNAAIVIERYANVPTLTTQLAELDDLYEKAVKLKVLAKMFWDSVQRRKSLRETLKTLSEVPELFTDLQTVRQQDGRLTQLKAVLSSYSTAKSDAIRLTGVISRLGETDALNGDIKAVKAKAETLARLQECKALYERRKSIAESAERTVEAYKSQYVTAQTELTEAWNAAGGVCPLCNQPIKGDGVCTH